MLVRFESVLDRTVAVALGGVALYIGSDERRGLEPGEYWPDELVGLTVRSSQETDVGVVEGVIEGPAQYRLSVRTPDGALFEVPFVAALVPDVDLAAGILVLADLPGLVPGT